jgi:predicted nucleic acid-binding protein
VILIDSNVLMYAAGTPHRHKAASAALIERIAAGKVDAVLDAEILQEILHRYRTIDRWSSGRELYDLARRIIPGVIPITVEILDAARSLLDAHSALMAGDALHAAVCREADLDAICTYDRDFDRIPGIRRLEPSQVP